MGVVAESRLDGLFVSLEASFAAAVDRAEDEAASDLAFSLKQGRRLVETLRTNGASVDLDGRLSPVHAVGSDHVRAGLRGSILVPFTHCVLALDASMPPPPGDSRSTVQVLREWARSGLNVQVRTHLRVHPGVLTVAAEDHLVVTDRERSWVVPYQAVSAISVVRGDSTDAP
ncbi:MAG: hypothetical protein M3345_00630 [Actinomycetota bacterium]|nr:hypothetical protein [Actinomycetota bacterium]